MAFIELLSGELKNLVEKTLKLTNFPRNHCISTLFPQLKHLDDAYDSEFQRKLIASIGNSKDLQKYLLASGRIGQHMQEKNDLQVTDRRYTK